MGESTGGGAESAWWSDPKACRKIDLIEPPPKKKSGSEMARQEPTRM